MPRDGPHKRDWRKQRRLEDDGPQPLWKTKPGELWRANTGGKKHVVAVISLDARNVSDRVSSILAVPFGSSGSEGPTSLRMEQGENPIGSPIFPEGSFRRMRELVAMVNRAIDRDEPYEGRINARNRQ
jgi:hypothetical protein